VKYIAYVTHIDGFEVSFYVYCDGGTIDAFTEAIRDWSAHFPNTDCSFRVERVKGTGEEIR